MNFRTHVILGEELKKKTDIPQKYHSRSILTDLNKYIQSNQTTDIVFFRNKVCALYGLQGTGKTTTMLRCIHSMTDDQFKKTAWIDITEEDTMANLYLDLNKLEDAGYEYVFIDEITKAKNFIRVSALLSDIKGRMLAEIILYNTKRSIEQSNDNKKVFKLVFSEYGNSPFTNGEYDMVILDDNGDIDLYEIKHTSNVYYDQQTKHLKDHQKLQYLISKGYRIGRKIVLYNRDSLPLNSDGIEYINVDYYLQNLMIEIADFKKEDEFDEIRT